jgi:hypothetical protein
MCVQVGPVRSKPVVAAGKAFYKQMLVDSDYQVGAPHRGGGGGGGAPGRAGHSGLAGARRAGVRQVAGNMGRGRGA